MGVGGTGVIVSVAGSDCVGVGSDASVGVKGGTGVWVAVDGTSVSVGIGDSVGVSDCGVFVAAGAGESVGVGVSGAPGAKSIKVPNRRVESTMSCRSVWTIPPCSCQLLVCGSNQKMVSWLGSAPFSCSSV